ncbi:putative orphan protein [Pseudoalteromonas translucida]|uniref:Orphan protein n=1 Tax=Pseudoalteromonas translucida (strain TAC 125) TaxID=326442 RepID=Q3IIN8_PSET1|nr:putative orphan protein [Pseudoalteromonas translucida]
MLTDIRIPFHLYDYCSTKFNHKKTLKPTLKGLIFNYLTHIYKTL